MQTIIITIYALATLLANGNEKEFYSQQLIFTTKTECIDYYMVNQAELLNGLMEHAQRAYNSEVSIKEAGCALVDFRTVVEDGKPTMLQKHPIYSPTSA